MDVRHAPTVRVTGERVIEEKKKESLFKFASKLSALERQACLVWIATPPSKMFVLKLQDESESASGSSSTSSSSSKRMELSPTAKCVGCERLVRLSDVDTVDTNARSRV